MLTLYLICLIIGGALVALSIFAGGDFDTEVDIEAAASFLSLRNGVFFAAFFGLTGTLLTVLRVGSLLTPIFAIGVGLIAALAMHRLIDYLRQNETGELLGPETLQGTVARVVVDIDETSKGKIELQGGDRTLQLVAGVHEQAEVRRFRAGDDVVIVDVSHGVAQVAGTAFLA